MGAACPCPSARALTSPVLPQPPATMRASISPWASPGFARTASTAPVCTRSAWAAVTREWPQAAGENGSDVRAGELARVG